MTGPSPITGRDEIWDAVLFHLAYNDAKGFKSTELDVPDAVSEHTVRRTLNSMEALGWLKRDSPRAHTYQPGDRLLFLAGVLRGQQSE